MPDASLAKRRAIIRRIEKARDSKVICYLTSLRQGVPALMSEDGVRQMMSVLLKVKKRPLPRIDIFLASNGGNSVVPWRIVALMREYAAELNVLIPYRAYSAATILALGADNIVMHPFAEMGPIDPTVSNDYNPTDGQTGRKIGISVEDVKAYLTFVKDKVGIKDENQLGVALQLLANQVHPLAIGNVERFLSQSRMVARKILQTHMTGEDSTAIIEDITENLASKLYFHGHPINRREARDQLQLKVTEPAPALEADMWELFSLYEKQFDSTTSFNPVTVFNAHRLAHNAQMLAQLAQQGALPPAGATPYFQPPPLSIELAHAVVEDSTMASWYRTTRIYSEEQMMGPQGPQKSLREDLLQEGWLSS